MTATADIAANWRVIRQRVDDAATRAGRDPATVQIIAVAKKQPASAVRAALAAGAVHIGENYVQELLGKRDELAADAVQPQWHFIGHLQRNKARMIAGQVSLIHAVDSIELAAEIAKRSVVRQLDEVQREVRFRTKIVKKRCFRYICGIGERAHFNVFERCDSQQIAQRGHQRQTSLSKFAFAPAFVHGTTVAYFYSCV